MAGWVFLFVCLFLYDFPNKFNCNWIVCGCFDLLVIFLLLRSYACYFFVVKFLSCIWCMKRASDLKVMVIVFGRNYSISWLNSSCCRHCTVQDSRLVFFLFVFFCQVMCRSLLGLSLIPSNRGYLNLLALFQITVSRCFLCDTHLIRQNMYQKWKKNGFKRLLVKPDMSIQCIKLLPSPGGLAVALPRQPIALN